MPFVIQKTQNDDAKVNGANKCTLETQFVLPVAQTAVFVHVIWAQDLSLRMNVKYRKLEFMRTTMTILESREIRWDCSLELVRR